MSTTFPVVKGVLLSSKHYTWNTADSLGRGASAIVYLGRQRETGLVVAVKSFHRHHIPSSRNADLRELDLLRTLNHPNIIQLLDIQFEESSQQPVLVMEYCEGGSLHHMLELPLYYYGLSENEYILVLSHVADGMEYLRNENIIHRDIKPGNIMRFITHNGESLYKLTDFGAARNLDEEEQFESLYGTEEYLHPDMYEKAVLRHSTGVVFDARIDLWSLGVTFFHAATGRLPFQPYGGRSNKEKMFQIISKKDSGVISGIQKSRDSPIEWKRELPESCPLSNGLKSLVTPMLSGLMEPDQTKMISYDTFFRMVDNMRQKTTVSIFHFSYCQEIVLYVDKNSTYPDIQDIIAEMVDISASDQILLVNGKPMDEVVDLAWPVSSYPLDIIEGGIFLFQTSVAEDIQPKELEIPPYPDIKKYSGMDTDARHANLCYAQGELISRFAKTVTNRQDVILRGLVCLRLYLESCHSSIQTSLELIQCLMLEFELHLDTFFIMLEPLKRVVAHNDRDREKLEQICQENVVRPVFLKARERLTEIEHYKQNLSIRLENTKRSISKLFSQCKKEKCCKKINHHLSVVSGIQSRFRRDKNVRHQMTTHDENIHHFEREKLLRHCTSLKDILVNHCVPQQAKLFRDAKKDTEILTRCVGHVNKIKVNLNSVVNCQKLLSEKIVNMRKTCKALSTVHDSGYASDRPSSSLPSNVSSMGSDLSQQAMSLENKLVQLRGELEVNSEYIRSLEDGPASMPSGFGKLSLEAKVSRGWTEPG